MDEMEAVYLKYMELVDAGQTPDLGRPPYNTPEFRRILEGQSRVDRGLKSVVSESLAPTVTPMIPNMEILGELGRGGMGRVYLGKDTALDRHVAVKVIPKLNNEQVIKRFLQESRILAQFSHPNIVSIFQHGETPEHFYFVMQYSEGATLKQIIEWIRENRVREASDVFKYVEKDIRELPAPNSASTVLDEAYIQKVLEIARNVADALSCAHEAGVVHRDIKPSNILVDPRGHVRILDFGISKMSTTPSVTATHELVGTPYYLAPELVRGEPATPKTDIYSLGVVLFESLALQVPFSDQTLDKLYTAIKEKMPPDVQQLRKEIPKQLNLIVQTCLEKSPGHRYQDMKTLLTDLDAFLVHESPPFARARFVQRLYGYARRSWKLAAAVIIVAVLCWTALRFSPSPSSEREGERSSGEGVVSLDPTIQIDLSTDKGSDGVVFHVGEKIRVAVKSNREGFLRLYYIQADNTVVRLVPNRYNGNDRIDAGTTYHFPSEHDRFDLTITPEPLGKEKIVAIVSSVPFDDAGVSISSRGNFDILQDGVPAVDESVKFKGIGMSARESVYNRVEISIVTTKEHTTANE